MTHVTWIVTSILLAAPLLSACRPVQVPTANPTTGTATASAATPSSRFPPTPVALGMKPTGWPTPKPQAVVLPTLVAVKLELRKDQITSQALAGNLLGDKATRSFFVLLPPDYAASSRRYPVVYVLPGGSGGAGSAAGDFQFEFQNLLATDEAGEMILVFPDGASILGGSRFISSPTWGDYESYLVHELVEYMDRNYRTLPTRDSRGLTGCSNGGDSSMRLAFKYPEVFSVVAPSGGLYDETLVTNPGLLRELALLTTLPETVSDLVVAGPLVQWYIQGAAGSAVNADRPPLYLNMPFRIVDGKAEIVPEVAAKITANDSLRAAEHYLLQPFRLHGILTQHALHDTYSATEVVRSFERRLNELGIEHEYREYDASHCLNPWVLTSLKFLSEHLAFEDPR